MRTDEQRNQDRAAGRGRRARERTGYHNTPAAMAGTQQTAPGSPAEASADAAEEWFAAANAWGRAHRAKDEAKRQAEIRTAMTHEAKAQMHHDEEHRRLRNGR